MLVFLSVRLMPQTKRAARLCTASSFFSLVTPTESQAHEAYSRIGRTSCLYAFNFMSSDVVMTFRRTKPRVELALADFLSTCWSMIVLSPREHPST